MSEQSVGALEAKVRDLEAALKQNDQSIMLAFNLPPKMGNLLGLLIALPAVTSQIIEHRLELVSDSKIAIFRLRKHLEKYDIKIQSRRTIGYWLDPATKKRTLEILNAGRDEPPAVVPSEDRVASIAA